MEGWKEYKLGDVLKRIIGGGTPSKSKPEYWNGKIYWCSVKDMSDGKLKILQTEDTITQLGLENSSANLIRAGSLITSTRMGLGRAFINLSDMAINQDLKALIPNDKTTTEFLLWLLLVKKDELEGLGTGSTVKGIRLDTLKSIKIKLPPLPTQRKIAAILSAYDDLIENNLKRIKLLEEMAQITYEEWFVRMKFPGHESAVFDEKTGLPEGWRKVKLGEVINVGRGSSPRPIADQKYFDGGSIPWLKIADATASHIYIYKTKEYVNEYGASFSRKLPAGSLIIAASGTLGFPMFLGVECCIHDGWIYFGGIKKQMKEYFYFNFINLKEYFNAISYGAAIQNINTGILRGSPFIIPTENILLLFHKQVQPVFQQIQNLQTQNQRLKEARDILLPRLMTGRISVDELSGEVDKN